jgi:hypothetical protein
MSEQFIKSGTGTGNLAGVTAENMLLTDTITNPKVLHRAFLGQAYNFNTGVIALTSGSESGVMYLKNTDSRDFILNNIAVGIGKLGGTVSDPAIISLYDNVSTGTLISDATGIDYNRNRNVGSTRTADALVYKGAEGKTITDGNIAAIFYQNGNGRLFASVDFVIPLGGSVAISITPNATTAGNIYCALVGYFES